MTLRQLAQDFFESPELQILFIRAATTSTGCFPDDVPGLQGLIHCLPLTLSFEPAAIAVGGSQAITDALVSAGGKLGVTYATSSDVDRIIVEGERATGVELADGSRISADLVISDLGLPQTVLRLLRDTPVDPRLRRQIGNINYDRGQLLWANLAIHEPPQYLADARQSGDGSPAAAVLGAEGSRLPASPLSAGDLPERLREPPVRAVLRRQPLGRDPRSRGQPHRRGRGVRRARGGASRPNSGARSRMGSSRTCCASGSATRRT